MFSFVSDTGILLTVESVVVVGILGRGGSTEGILSLGFVSAGDGFAAGCALGRDCSTGGFLTLALVSVDDFVAFFLAGFSFFSFPFLAFFLGLGAKSLSSEKSDTSASSKPSKLSESLSEKEEETKIKKKKKRLNCSPL